MEIQIFAFKNASQLALQAAEVLDGYEINGSARNDRRTGLRQSTSSRSNKDLRDQLAVDVGQAIVAALDAIG